MTDLKKILIGGVITLGFLFSADASSQNIKIGYVDLKEVFSKFEKANEMEANFVKDVEAEQKKVSQEEAEIKKMQAEYEKKKDVMKPEERAKKEEELKNKIQVFSRMWSEVNKKLDEKRKELESNLLEEIKKEVKVYGEKNGFTVILDSRVIIYGQDIVNLTSEIIKLINK
jgi:outer membrane protein